MPDDRTEFQAAVKRYMDAFDTMSDEAQSAVRDKLRSAVDQYLMVYREPESYRESRSMVDTIGLGLVSWLIAEGYLIVPAAHFATDEQREAREEKRNTAHVMNMATGESVEASAAPPRSTRYL